ncbi:MAG TPA: isocitrate lyase/phosphoenolpyruvate mutase family protein [Terracidiphilus sp.]|jgi:2-methylisocitrate lyase-like PEP mutase family enzyme|nr:isocitrate lyase/phosphoenolpyruvate mutase family protein [Terracidiphilus sp.]
MVTQSEKGRMFRALHERKGAFLLPNPWDAGSAHLLARMGFEAVATTSAGFAFSQARRDYHVDREAMLAHVSVMAAAVDLPLSGDLENGYGDSPQAAAETIRLGAAAGLVGGSIEDATGREDDPIYRFDAAVERVRAAAEAAHGLDFPFTLTARAENFLHGRPDLDDTIQRLQAFEEAGADVLYAPGLSRLEDIATVVHAVSRPVNVLAAAHLEMAALEAIGVRRVSVGSALARAAYGGFLRAVEEMRSKGTFRFAEQAVSYQELSGMF